MTSQPPSGSTAGKTLLTRSIKGFLAVIGAASAILGLYAAVSGLSGNEEVYRRSEVERYADDYFTAAVSDPAGARRSLTTDAFRRLPGAADPGYVEWWGTVESAEVQRVLRTSDKNWFEIEFVVRYRDGRTQSVRSNWLITCADGVRKYAPFLDCSSDELRLDDLDHPGSHD